MVTRVSSVQQRLFYEVVSRHVDSETPHFEFFNRINLDQWFVQRWPMAAEGPQILHRRASRRQQDMLVLLAGVCRTVRVAPFVPGRICVAKYRNALRRSGTNIAGHAAVVAGSSGKRAKLRVNISRAL